MPSAAAVPTRTAHDAIRDRPSRPPRDATAAALAWLARSGARTGDHPTRRAHDVPHGAEGVQALPVLLSGAAVTGVVVQRMAAVGDLRGAVSALDRAQQRGLDAAARLGGAAGLVDRPRRHAGAAAGRLVGLVLLEQVQRAPAAV